MRTHLLAALAALMALSGPLLAQNSGASVDEAADAADRRWAEYREKLESKSAVTRAQALSAALADSNVGIRGEAIWLILHRNTSLPVSVVVAQGGDAGDVPTPAIGEIRWQDSDKTFKGTASSGFRSRVMGQVVGAQLFLDFPTLGIPSGLGNSTGRPQRSPVARHACKATLTVNASREALTGPLICNGLRVQLPLTLPLG